MQKLYIMCGIPFSGKTVLSKQLAEKLLAVRIDLDEVKLELLGDVPDERVSKTQWDSVYQAMYKLIERTIINGKSVIQDAGNFTRYERDLIRNIATENGIPTIVIYVEASLSLAQQRRKHNEETRKRFQVSDETLLLAAKEMEPPETNEFYVTYHGEPIHDWIKQLLDK